MSLGKWGGFPFKLGSTQAKPTKIAYRAMLDALEPAFDPTTGTYHEIETFALARVEGMTWGAGKRMANQAIPAKMLEALPVWEDVLELTPTAETSDYDRRASVGGKLRGVQNNAIPDIEAVCSSVLGINYEEVRTVDLANVVAYWPGGTPGPPGYEWASNNATIAVAVNKRGLDDAAFLAKIGTLRSQLDDLLPSWMTYTVGIGSSFIVSRSIVGEDLI